MRDLSKPIEVQAGGETLMLRLDMTAMLDFETVTGITVSDFVRALLPVFGAWQDQQADAEADANEAGLRMLDDLLAVPVLSAKNVLHLAWALAGGEDLGQTPREFGRRVNVGTGREIITGVWEAVREGMPEGNDDADAPAPDEDPTQRPECETSGQ